MSSIADRYNRNILLFGAKGQEKLSETRVVVAGVGGLGSPIVQHLALLGVGQLALIEPEELDDTNRNRFIGARAVDPVPGSRKVVLGHRLVREINPDVAVITVPNGLISPVAFAAIKEAHWVFGCFDADGPRFVLNELCSAYSKPYIDVASDVPEANIYGGRVFVNQDGRGCLSCCDLLDREAVKSYISTPADVALRKEIYGVPKEVLAEQKGPSVSPMNGVIASLGAMEFMVAVTGLRTPKRLLNYRGYLGKLTNEDEPKRTSACYFCESIRGKKESADVERYLKIPHLH
jgi:molybdopterin/thiamine biosynthesis adenylyltransferase